MMPHDMELLEAIDILTAKGFVTPSIMKYHTQTPRISKGVYSYTTIYIYIYYTTILLYTSILL